MRILDQVVPPGEYTRKAPFAFTTPGGGVFGGQRIPADSDCQFFETANFGWLFWVEPNGDKHLTKE